MIDFIRDDALVIGKKDFGEADRYITVFTQNFGRQTFLLKGVRKSKKRELSSVDILSLTKFTFYKKGENFVVSNFNGIDNYMELRQDLGKLGIASYILGLLNMLLVENNRKKSLFETVLRSLEFLKNCEEKEKRYILVGYLLYYVIKDEGLKIDMGEGEMFSFQESSFVEEKIDTLKVSKEIKNTVEKYVLGRGKEIARKKNKIEDIEGAISFFEKYINYHLGINIKLKNYVMED